MSRPSLASNDAAVQEDPVEKAWKLPDVEEVR